MTEPTEERIPDAGASTDQFVSDLRETGDFATDEEPAADTPAHGSSNLGVNTTGANRTEGDEQDG